MRSLSCFVSYVRYTRCLSKSSRFSGQFPDPGTFGENLNDCAAIKRCIKPTSQASSHAAAVLLAPEAPLKSGVALARSCWDGIRAE